MIENTKQQNDWCVSLLDYWNAVCTVAYLVSLCTVCMLRVDDHIGGCTITIASIFSECRSTELLCMCHKQYNAENSAVVQY